MQRLSSLLIGFGLGIFGMSLLYDPWGQERFERTVRETARLENSLLNDVDIYLQMKMFLGYMLVACSFVSMNRIGLLYVLAIPALLVYAALNYNHVLYKSERLGGEQIIQGALFYVAFCFALIDGLIKPKKLPQPKQSEKNVQKKKNE
ncbi:unnamed protein product (macronuclear) [Paramecium tetraurelia]|uniref:Uncharacterized protein n=1 Tax=Paramecium tetraurelia TaxID=5888 RepID=A0EAX7_PARTE|nr:uncharacterized protein GSPATT00025178001 [Paramecium tetraurelia]CAK92444.1 unnamed protein product [Paramecium tetraurelia]|eukprot:XP_001459841.1 hypothetical protein (macronuclear) [Paramecium tetraurelia strain d4-2]